MSELIIRLLNYVISGTIFHICSIVLAPLSNTENYLNNYYNAVFVPDFSVFGNVRLGKPNENGRLRVVRSTGLENRPGHPMRRQRKTVRFHAVFHRELRFQLVHV